jgi:spermidine synthase
VDGIQIGGSDPGLDYKQQWLAHLPKLLMDDYKTEVSVGLGSRILVGESARHKGLEKIICLEIAPSVVAGAAYFQDENYGVLDSPKVEVVVNDAVNYLLTSRNRYDIISTDGKTKPEYGVNGVFFSQEYYTLMRDHLAPGGVAIQWIPIHYPPEIFKTVLNTFCQTFPHALIWYSENNCFLVGSNEAIALKPEAIDRKLSDSAQPYDGLRKFGITSAASLLAQLVAAEDVIRELSTSDQKLVLNTMEKPIIEFYDLAAYQVPETERKRENLDFLLSIRGKGRVEQELNQMPNAVRTAHAAEATYLVAQRLVLKEAKRHEIERHFDKALDLDPDNPHLRHHIYGHYLETGKSLMDQANWERAKVYVSKAVELWPHDADARYRMGFIYMKLGRGEDALGEYEASLELNPKRLHLRQSLAETYLLNKMTEHAIRHYEIILEAHPDDVKARQGLQEALMQVEKLD